MAFYTRLTPNTKDWTEASGKEGKCSGAQNTLFEGINNFGFEEWYRSELFQETDPRGITWQYGYWQCFKNTDKKKYLPGVYKDFTVYTRFCTDSIYGTKTSQITNQLVAHYAEIEVLNTDQRERAHALFNSKFADIKECLKRCSGNDEAFDWHISNYHLFNIRFNLQHESYVFHEHNVLDLELKGNRFGVYER